MDAEKGRDDEKLKSGRVGRPKKPTAAGRPAATGKKTATGKSTTARKKAAAGKATGVRMIPKKQLLKAPPQNAFYCVDGKLFYDLIELAEGLQKISLDTFFYHVHDGNNDFSNWVRDVIQDIELADELASTIDKAMAIAYVASRLKYYE